MLQIAIVAVTGAFAFGFVLCAMLVSGTEGPEGKRAGVSEGWKSGDTGPSSREAIQPTRGKCGWAPFALVTTVDAFLQPAAGSRPVGWGRGS